MLDERIEAYSEIGNTAGIFFICRHLNMGIESRESLYNLRLHHVGSISINIDAALLLLDSLKREYDDDYSKMLSYANDNSLIQFQETFSSLLTIYLLTNNVIRIDFMRYEESSNQYYLLHQGIKRKFACYRNLLLSLGVLSKRKPSGFYYHMDSPEIRKSVVKHRQKITLQELEQTLIKQREEGQIGELFVLKYEQKRLSTISNISEIKQISEFDVAAGYDIISFNESQEPLIRRYIEVKTYIGKPHFYWSSNERNIATQIKENYFIYLVDAERVEDASYEPIIISNPIRFFEDNIDWKKHIETIYLEQL